MGDLFIACVTAVMLAAGMLVLIILALSIELVLRARADRRLMEGHYLTKEEIRRFRYYVHGYRE